MLSYYNLRFNKLVKYNSSRKNVMNFVLIEKKKKNYTVGIGFGIYYK